MPADYVRRTYGVNIYRGDRIEVDGRPGTVVSFPGQYLGVRFDGERHTSRCHPTWRVLHLGVPGTPRPLNSCQRLAPEVGHEREGYSCSTHNMPWGECPKPGGSDHG